MPTIYAPLVGSHFYPPAKVLLSHLPSGAELFLEPEPDNQYDSNALKVLLPINEIEAIIEGSCPEELETELLGCGWSLQQLQELSEPLHLGYIAASAKTALGYSLNTQFLSILSGAFDWQAALSFTPEGKYLVRLNY